MLVRIRVKLLKYHNLSQIRFYNIFIFMGAYYIIKSTCYSLISHSIQLKKTLFVFNETSRFFFLGSPKDTAYLSTFSTFILFINLQIFDAVDMITIVTPVCYK